MCVPIDLKIGTHIDWIYAIFLVQKLFDQNSVTFVSMVLNHIFHYKA